MGPADSHRITRVPRYSGYHYASCMLRVRDYHPLWSDFPDGSSHNRSAKTWSYNPRGASPRSGFGLIPGRSPLLGESLLFSLPRGTKMFQFPPFASLKKYSDDRPSTCRVVPFGNLRINGYLHLPEAYRSLSRPSSPE